MLSPITRTTHQPEGPPRPYHNAVFVVPTSGAAVSTKKKVKKTLKKKRRGVTPTYITKTESDARVQLFERTARDLRAVNSALADEVQRSREDADKDLGSMRGQLNIVEQTLHEEHEKAVVAKEKLAAEVAAHVKATASAKEKQKDLKHRLKRSEESLHEAEDELTQLRRELAHVEERLVSAEACAEREQQARLAQSSELVKVQAALEMLRHTHADLAEREHHAAERARRLEADRKDLGEKLSSMDGALRNVTERNAELAERVREVDAERSEMREAAAKARGDAETSISVMREQLGHAGGQLKLQEAATEKALGDCEDLRRQLFEARADAEAKASQCRELDSSLRAARESGERAESALERTKRENEAIAVQCKRDLEAAAGERRELVAVVEAERARAVEAEAAYALKEVEVEVARQEAGACAEQMRIRDEECHATLITLRTVEDESARHRTDASVSAEREHTLRQELQRERERTERLAEEKSAAEGAAMSAEAALKERVESTRVAHAAVDVKEAEVRDMRLKLESAQEEAARWQERHVTATHEKEHVREQGENEVLRHQSEVMAKERQIKELADVLSGLNDRLAAAQNEVMSERDRREEELRARDAAHAAEMDRLRSELSRRDLDYQMERNSISGDTAQIREKLSGVEHAKMIAENAARSAEGEARRLQSELSALQRRVEVAEDAARGAAEEYSGRTGAHQRELESKAAVVSNLLAAMQAEERAKLEFEAEARTLRGRLQEAEGQLAAVLDERDRLGSSARHLKKKAAIYKKENHHLLSSYDQFLRQAPYT